MKCQVVGQEWLNHAVFRAFLLGILFDDCSPGRVVLHFNQMENQKYPQNPIARPWQPLYRFTMMPSLLALSMSPGCPSACPRRISVSIDIPLIISSPGWRAMILLLKPLMVPLSIVSFSTIVMVVHSSRRRLGSVFGPSVALAPNSCTLFAIWSRKDGLPPRETLVTTAVSLLIFSTDYARMVMPLPPFWTIRRSVLD